MAKAFDQRQMQALAAKKAAFRAAPLHNVRASKGMGPNKACGHKAASAARDQSAAKTASGWIQGAPGRRRSRVCPL